MNKTGQKRKKQRSAARDENRAVGRFYRYGFDGVSG